jgi:hypothetical protein
MKKSALFINAVLLTALLISICAAPGLYAQDSKQQKQDAKDAAFKMLIDSQRYIFEAQSATSSGGNTRQLTYGYDLIIKKDSVEAYLPFYGRAYSATIGSSDDGGIQFKTSDFDYTVKERKKGGWDVTIKPKNVKDVSQILLSISKAGYTTVYVNSNNRAMISFYGYIKPIKN